MGGDMANVKNSNLKVPPLKIVLSSATSGGSDTSSSTSPSSESESLDSNLTIISDNQHDRSFSGKSDNKEDPTQVKQERTPRPSAKCSSSDRSSSTNVASSSGKRSHDNTNVDLNNGDPAPGREQTSSSNQRITRSSQRAAQQNKSENPIETNGDETNVSEVQDKAAESARKVKRRKGEPQDSEQDNNQQVPPPPLLMANICPADYELPTQNSFELYRDIRKRPYNKLMKLTTVQPRAPHGFRDYVLNSGPYLLDGGRIGVGIRGSTNSDPTRSFNIKSCHLLNRITPKLKYGSVHPKFSATISQRQNYAIPKQLEAPKNLRIDSPLYELFIDQEKSRQRMRMQHLKERERSILTAEQEILRAYNKAAMVESQQDFNLSACTYLYLQERYHYIDEKNDSIDCVNPKDLIANATSLEAKIVENDQASQMAPNDCGPQDSNRAKSSNLHDEAAESTRKCEDQQENPNQIRKTDNSEATSATDERVKCISEGEGDQVLLGNMETVASDARDLNGKTCDIDTFKTSKSDGNHSTKKELAISSSAVVSASVGDEAEALGKSLTESEKVHISPADRLSLEQSAFLDNLQEIDEKWTNIKKEMLLRHKNEADSLLAVQSLDWEWKAKEIGACDVRVALKIDPELVPRVEVAALDY